MLVFPAVDSGYVLNIRNDHIFCAWSCLGFMLIITILSSEI
jgi:hypothetical protein